MGKEIIGYLASGGLEMGKEIMPNLILRLENHQLDSGLNISGTFSITSRLHHVLRALI